MSLGGSPSDAPSSPSSIRRWLREPLLHFLAIGLAVFAVYRAISPEPDRREGSNRIEVTEADLDQLAIAWRAQWRRPPTPEEMRGLLEAKIREEMLYREALALGLEKGDTIVMRRLAQKMEFLAEDVAAVREPQIDELRAWFEKNRERFALPALMSFRHLYFSFDQRHERARDDAVRSLEMLVGKSADAPETENLADPFMYQDYYGDRLPEQVAGEFGSKFAEALFELKPGAWRGPIESGFGWHLIWIDSMTPGRVPAFEDVEALAKSDWITEQRAEAKRQMFEAMRARYEVVLPKARATAPAGEGSPSAKAAP
jgi:peptidyl-prolyl cis-trans isomerase C